MTNEEIDKMVADRVKAAAAHPNQAHLILARVCVDLLAELSKRTPPPRELVPLTEVRESDWANIGIGVSSDDDLEPAKTTPKESISISADDIRLGVLVHKREKDRAPFYLVTWDELNDLFEIGVAWGEGDRMPNAVKARFDQATSRPLKHGYRALVSPLTDHGLAIQKGIDSREYDFFDHSGKPEG